MSSKVFIKNKTYSIDTINTQFSIASTNTISLSFINEVLSANFVSLNLSQFINDTKYLSTVSTDKVTITGDGTESNPLVASGTGPAFAVLIDFTATMNISAFDVVTSTGIIADSSNISIRNKVIGISITDVLNGFTGKAVGFGEIQNSGWSWVIGSKLFLNGTSISTTAPSTGFIQIIGTATKADTIDIKLAQTTLL